MFRTPAIHWQVILIRAGEMGYTRLKRQPPGYPPYDGRGAQCAQDKFIKELNSPEVTPGQRAAMEWGSMFGWETGGADSDHYNADGTFKKKYPQPA